MTNEEWQARGELLREWAPAFLYGYNATDSFSDLQTFGRVGNMLLGAFKRSVLQV